MGVVPIKVVGSISSHGDVCLTYVAYIYCDNCGSFNIKKESSGKQGVLVTISCLLVAHIIFFGFTQLMFAIEWWIVLFMLFIVIGIILFALWGNSAYRCKKCGDLTTIRYNTRNFSSNSIVVDVPDQLIQKIGLTGWPDDQSIETYLSPPDKPKQKV